MAYQRIAIFLWACGMILALVSMVLGPFGYTNQSVMSSVGAGFLALVGFYPAFRAWEDEEED